MSIKLDKYTPLIMYLSPASIPQIVAHIQDYLVKHPILSVETIAEIIVQSLQEHPELINGEAIPISAESEQSIKAYIDALPALDTYTKAEINALLLGKQDTLTFDQAPTPGSSNPVTSSGIIAAMSALQSALETQISAKADRGSTYTKTQVDTLLEDKADADAVYTKNTMDAKLLEVNTNIDNLEDALGEQSQQIEDLGPYNGLDSDSTTAALSAAQGKVLNGGIAALGSGLAVISEGDTHGPITAGQYVYIRNHSSLTEGLYKAKTDINTDGSLLGNVAIVNGLLNTPTPEIVIWRGWVNGTNVSIKPKIFSPTYLILFTHDAGMALYITNWIGSLEVYKILSYGIAPIEHSDLTISANGIITVTLETYETMTLFGPTFM